jgi:alkanesulfonate monooxygenase SsuD/methylene tetrahydromethanopterin reductase-like flavin-dependent oxidoreductase (luciferase family)
MQIGVALPQFEWEGPLGWGTVVDAARHAEELDFDSVWLADHLFLDPARYGQPPSRAKGFDPFIGLAALARATTRIELGTLVICAQLRPATVVAKMLANLDRISHGRVIAGIGAGWFEPEYEAAGIPFLGPGQRVRQVEDAVTTMKAMWSAAPDAPPCHPAPETPGGPPVWVAGKGDKMMEIAVRRADGFNHQGWTDESGPRRFDAFRATCERLGRDPASIPLSCLQAVNDFDALKDQMARFAAEGVTTVILSVGQVPFGTKTFDAMDRLASAVR